MTIHFRNVTNLCIIFNYIVFLFSELLERVLFRLGVADTDEQLESAVLKFLTPVLLKITSPNDVVRKKVTFL